MLTLCAIYYAGSKLQDIGYTTAFPLQSWRNFLYIFMPEPLDQPSKLQQVSGAEQRTARPLSDYCIFGNDVGPGGRNRHQMLALFVKVGPVLTPGVKIRDEFELLA
jgi:hypothetical protein